MYVSVLPVCMHTMYVPGALGGQKRAVYLPELELEMVVSCQVGVETEPRYSMLPPSGFYFKMHISLQH